MFPLILAGALWGYNAVRIAQLANRNKRIKKRDSDDAERNLTIFKDCNFYYEDKRTYNYYNNCTFNIYVGGKKDG